MRTNTLIISSADKFMQLSSKMTTYLHLYQYSSLHSHTSHTHFHTFLHLQSMTRVLWSLPRVMATSGRVYFVVYRYIEYLRRALNYYSVHFTLVPCSKPLPRTKHSSTANPEQNQIHSFMHKSLLEQVLLTTSPDSVNARTLDDDNSWTQVLAEHQRRGTKFTDPDFPPEVGDLRFEI